MTKANTQTAAAQNLVFRNHAPSRALVVEDDATMLAIIQSMLEKQGYSVLTAGDGQSALELISREKDVLDIVLLDRTIPGPDGMEVVRRLQHDPALRHIPIVMQTGSDKPQQIREGLDAGVFYYLLKPFTEEVLQSVVTSAMRTAYQRKALRKEMRRHHASFPLINTASFSFKTVEEAESLACFVANCFPDAERVLSGLSELLINAVEHGNLGLGFTAKTKLVADGSWRAELMRRQSLQENAGKTAELTFARLEGSIEVHIADQGKGFDWKEFMHIDPSRALENHGRGIAQASMISFDELRYNDKGNEVTAVVRLAKDLKW